MAKVNVYSIKGKKKKSVELPPVFSTEVRIDIIRKAVNTIRANRRQAYAPSLNAGMRHAVSTWGKGRGVARVQRLKDGRTAAESPNNVGGRRAHPPRAERVWKEKLNRKEMRLARYSALSASAISDMVKNRGHRFSDKLTLPVVVEDKLEKITSTREAVEVLQNLGLYEDVERARDRKHIRAGRGKMRGRRYKRAKSILILVSDRKNALKAFGNLEGVDIAVPSKLNAEILAPGGDPGRLLMMSQKALEEIKEWST